LEYINKLPEAHLLFAYHWLQKDENEYWDRMGAHLGTLWDRDQLIRLMAAPKGSVGSSSRVFVPLSLVVNPDLPNALLGKSKTGQDTDSSGDGLHTGMTLPEGDEVVNMAEMDKDEFLDVIGRSGLGGVRKR
jgi:hypothetical protein